MTADIYESVIGPYKVVVRMSTIEWPTISYDTMLMVYEKMGYDKHGDVDYRLRSSWPCGMNMAEAILNYRNVCGELREAEEMRNL